jgi:peptidoglycan/xylan/chitin deacetylase (PgdA/CDA1 family)
MTKRQIHGFSFRSKLQKWLDEATVQTIISDISHAVSPERFGPKLSERVLWRIETNNADVALTFDDGPHASSTPQILNALSQLDVKATFFMVGKHIRSNPHVTKAISEEGHEIGNHTFSHHLMFVLTNNQIKEEIMRTDELIKEINGCSPRFLRPPVGLFTKRILNIVEQLGYQMVVGDVYPRDPHMPGKRKIVKRVLQRASPGSIIILHDGGNSKKIDRTQTVEALKEIIPRLRDKGLRFVTLSELLEKSL